MSEVIGMKYRLCVQMLPDQVNNSNRHVTIPFLLPILS